ncbi:MAG: Unknown protein [uncultured Sulfurovum sp.]|uniref:Uncharacterized protein n=1 Tax=uncultured Sulfurovum sp. TaxID=269237 RepID=A0A6S6TMA6_9BACT|nr:MAG: Unknown protein [uncultured Sulfurovum sp.]
MKDFEDLKELRAEFDAMTSNPDEYCADGACPTDEEGINLRDYPSYTEALYSRLVAPHVSGIYLSRWDIKGIAGTAGDSMSIHPRKRMFELLMKFAVSQERMQLVLDALEEHMQDKIDIYKEIAEKFPHSAPIFQEKIDKAEGTIRLFPHIMKEYF